MRRACDCIALIALTGARRGEIQHLRWRHVDLDGRRMILPPDEHKAGRKTGKTRVIGLPADAVAILAGYLPEEGDPPDPDALVFSGLRPDVPVALQKPWERIAEEAKLPSSITLHSLRHGVGTLLAAQGKTPAAARDGARPRAVAHHGALRARRRRGPGRAGRRDGGPGAAEQASRGDIVVARGVPAGRPHRSIRDDNASGSAASCPPPTRASGDEPGSPITQSWEGRGKVITREDERRSHDDLAEDLRRQRKICSRASDFAVLIDFASCVRAR